MKIVLFLLLSSCTWLRYLWFQEQKSVEDVGKTGFIDQNISIGVVLPLTGVYASFGETCLKAVRLAYDTYPNAQQFTLWIEDSGSQVQGAVQATNKLLFHHHVDVIMGEILSQSTLAMANLTDRMAVPLVAPGSTHSDLLLHPSVIRLCFDNLWQANAMLLFLAKQGYHKAALLINSDSEYSRNLASEIEKQAGTHNIQISLKLFYQEQDTQYQTILKRIKRMQSDLDVVVVPGTYHHAGPLLRQARELNLTIPFQGTDSWHDESLFELSQSPNPCSSPVFISTHFAPDEQTPEIRQFVEAFQKRYGSLPGQMEALCYDASIFLLGHLNHCSAQKCSKEEMNKKILSDQEFCEGLSGCYRFSNRNPEKPVYFVKKNETSFSFYDKVLPSSIK